MFLAKRPGRFECLCFYIQLKKVFCDWKLLIVQLLASGMCISFPVMQCAKYFKSTNTSCKCNQQRHITEAYEVTRNRKHDQDLPIC